jgi:hypothetical protein
MPRRPSPVIEAVAYFVVSESLTNITKHAQASQAEVVVQRAGDPQNATAQPQSAQPRVAQAQATMIRTVTVPQPVTSLTVQSYGAPVQITGRASDRVHGIATNPDARRSITVSSAGGPLTVGP